ncbi:ribosome modulation factor [Methylobacterium symbioticum]|jgi:ribosome modulation factor|uniref:Ribosome modulation factor n=1 Tax=Methylobacterium symbioticum TaxID=2584084 RepID=A0A509ED40_9HYPH|nr:Rmf/CrpP family protein [Methylobacterium symbioticum]VUD71379.1 hypothetical protein MET9862_01959 [Methylobacterium symbioticum]
MATLSDHPQTRDPVTEGARARAAGRPKDACPYPAASQQRADWLAGYDGLPPGRPPDPPAEGA